MYRPITIIFTITTTRFFFTDHSHHQPQDVQQRHKEQRPPTLRAMELLNYTRSMTFDYSTMSRVGGVLAHVSHAAGQRGGVPVGAHPADVPLAALAVVARLALAAAALAHSAARRYHVRNVVIQASTT